MTVTHCRPQAQPRTGSCARPRRRARLSRGQALIEFTFFFSFMMLLLAMVTDVAFLVDAHVNVVLAARQGARTAAVLGDKTGADCAILNAVHATLLNQSDVTVTQIIIYKATVAPYLPTSTFEEVYGATSACAAGATSPTPGPSISTYPATGNTRNTTPFTEDSIGVQIQYQYQFRFGLLGAGTFGLSDQAVYPLNVQVPTP